MSDAKSAYWPSEKFEAELIHELGSDFHSRAGALILSRAPARELVWAHQTWPSLQTIEITSIGDAAKKLLALDSKISWSLSALEHARRSVLIEEQLGSKNAAIRFRKKLKFLDERRPLGSSNLGEFGLAAPGILLASSRASSWVPRGEPAFEESAEAPSRAYLKLWELFTVEGFHPVKGDACLDLGASPGGWTWVLAKLGATVTSLDKADLAPHVAKMPGVSLLRKDAFKLKPTDIGKLDWLFSDVICEPRKLLALIHEWRESGLCKNFVCTIKFKGETDFAVLKDFLKIEGSRARHLFHNKHEVTWWSVEPSLLK